MTRRAPAGVTARRDTLAATDTIGAREPSHWFVPLFLLTGAGGGTMIGAAAGATVPTRCFGQGSDAAATGALAGLAVVAVAIAGDELDRHVIRRHRRAASSSQPDRRSAWRKWVLEPAAIGGGLGAATGLVGGVGMYASRPDRCFRSAPKAALHGALLYGATGAIMFVPLAIISAS